MKNIVGCAVVNLIYILINLLVSKCFSFVVENSVLVPFKLQVFLRLPFLGGLTSRKTKRSRLTRAI